jgi:hypothetical protein
MRWVRTLREDDRPIWINLRQVESVEPFDGGWSRVHFAQRVVVVQHNPQGLLRALEASQAPQPPEDTP